MIGLRSIGLTVVVVIVGVALFQRAAVLEAERAAHFRTLVEDRDAALSEIREGNFKNADTPLDSGLAGILNGVRP